MDVMEGHGEICVLCQQPCDGQTSNARLWPVMILRRGGNQPHHQGCVHDRLDFFDTFRRLIVGR